MMNKSKYIFSLLIFLSGLFSSCSEKVEVQLGETDPKVVIEAYVSTEADSSIVRLSKTISYFSKNLPPPVVDGVVEVNDGTNLYIFNHTTSGVYKPTPGFKAVAGKTYTLRVLVDGNEYTSTSTLYRMFKVDSNFVFEFKPAEGFLPEGYAVSYLSNEDREGLIFTKFNFGVNDTMFDQSIIFNNDGIVKNQVVPFELPFFRVNSGDEVMVVFRTMEKQVADYLVALGNLNSGAPGPFQTPPANPPTNISGGAIGYFMTTDVIRIEDTAP